MLCNPLTAELACVVARHNSTLSSSVILSKSSIRILTNKAAGIKIAADFLTETVNEARNTHHLRALVPSHKRYTHVSIFDAS